MWVPDERISLDNPLGGVVYGLDAIRTLYRRIFEGTARVWIELYDFVEYVGADLVVFAGRERGEFSRNGQTLPLAIRTSRTFAYFGPELGWRQVYHHGSIDAPDALGRYQRSVRER